MNKNPIYCAVDTSDLENAKSIIEKVAPYIGGIKLGLEFFTSCGLSGIEQIKKYGFLQAELDKSKEEIIERLKQFKLAEETRSSYSFVREYTRHFTEDEMISGPEKYLEYTKDILPTITLEDINSYFNNYIKNENQVLESHNTMD